MAATLAIASLYGCGGGGGNDSTPAPVVTTTTTTTTTKPGSPTTTLPGSSLSLDEKGTFESPVTIAAASGITYTDAANKANYVVITGFSAKNTIKVSGATETNYNTAISSDSAGTVTIKYNSGTNINQIVLPGAIPAPVGSAFVSDVASFNALAIGDLVFEK